METQVQMQPERGTPPPQWNALKHGQRSTATLLPNDDAEEFHALRDELFETYRPRNRQEAARVEGIASLEWRLARCRRFQAVHDGRVEALLFPGGQPALHICEPDSHRWSHEADDCTRQEGRLQRHLRREQEALLLMQDQRRKQRMATLDDAEPVFRPEYAVRPVGPAGSAVMSSTAETHAAMASSCRGGSRSAPEVPPSDGLGQPKALAGNGGETAAPASASSHGECGKNDERTASALEATPIHPVAGLPRKQRRALERRLAKEQRRRERAARHHAASTPHRGRTDAAA